MVAGRLFPRRLELTALDYAGQHLGRIGEYFGEGEDLSSESTAGTVAEWISRSERLLFILDVDRLVFPEKFQEAADGETATISWGLEQYISIIEATDPEDVIVVATKCDILIDQRSIPAPGDLPSHDAFTQAVTEHLTTRPDVQRLLDLTGEEAIVPVYIETRRSDGEYVPRLDGNGNLIPVGYDTLISEIQVRQ